MSQNDILNLSVEESLIVTIGGKSIYFIGILIMKSIERGRKNQSEKSFLILILIPLVTAVSFWLVLGLNVDKRVFVILSIIAVFANIMAFSLNEFIIAKNNHIRNLEIENSKNCM